MAQQINRLSSTKVSKTKEPGYHHDGAGLYLQVSPALTKSWIFRYTRAGKTREMGLGPLATFTLEEARERARKQRQLLADGLDPIDVRDAQRDSQRAEDAKTLTFAECCEKYISAKKAGWENPKHVEQWRRTLDEYAGPVIGKLPVQAVDTGLVMKILEPIWTETPETASRLRGRIERVLDWAKVRGYRTGENPARWRGHLESLLPKKGDVHKVEHLQAMPYKKISAFMADLKEQPGEAARAVELVVLAAARSGEVRGAKPAEFNLDEALWIVPAERMKARKEHRVPLPPRAVEIVRAQLKAHPDAEFVFPGIKGQALSDMSLTAVLRRMKVEGATVHGFRSSFRDWGAEQTSYPREMLEIALAHKVGNEVERAYLRSDMMEKRRRLMNDWARYCATPKGSEKVTPIRKSV